jgi:hypothetical protein
MLPLQIGDLGTAVGQVSSDPVSLLLLVIGNLLMAVTFVVMGYLSLGGVIAALAPE